MQKCGHWAALCSALQPLFQSPPLSLSLFWHHFPSSASLLCLYFPFFPSSLMLFRLLTHPSFRLFPSHFLVSSCYLDPRVFSHISQCNITILVFALPQTLSQCSCRQTRPTQCCDGCAGPTSCWRRWSRATSSGSAARRSAHTRRPARLLRTMRRRWGNERQIISDLQFLLSSRPNTHRNGKVEHMKTLATHCTWL